MDFLKQMHDQKDAFLTDLNALVSVESTRDLDTKGENAPFGKGCRQVLDVFLDMAKRDGFENEDIDGYAGVVQLGDKANDDTLGILGHLDIVPLGKGWTRPPLQVTEEEGYIFGRGVMDDKGPALAAYYGLKMVRDAGIPLRKRIMFIAGCDEESGMECMKYYKEHAEVPKMGFVPDADFPVIYGEKGGAHIVLKTNRPTKILKLEAGSRPNIVIGEAAALMPKASKQQLDEFAYYLKTNGLEGSVKELDEGTEFFIKGAFAHAATPYEGINAAVHLFNFIGASYEDSAASDFARLLKDWQGKALGIACNGMYMGFLTVNPGIVKAGENGIEVLLDIRYPNDVTADVLMASIDKTLAGTGIEAVLESDSKPLFVDPNSELVTKLMDIYRKRTGDEFSCPITIGGGTYARKFDNFVSYGPELPNASNPEHLGVGGCHQKDEGIKLENLLQAAAIYADAIVSLAGAADADA